MVIRLRRYDQDNDCYISPEAKYCEVTAYFTSEDELNLKDFRRILL